MKTKSNLVALMIGLLFTTAFTSCEKDEKLLPEVAKELNDKKEEEKKKESRIERGFKVKVTSLDQEGTSFVSLYLSTEIGEKKTLREIGKEIHIKGTVLTIENARPYITRLTINGKENFVWGLSKFTIENERD